MRVGEQVEVTTRHGVVAVDGEREIELHGRAAAAVRLRADGPRCVDVSAAMAEAAGAGLFRHELSLGR